MREEEREGRERRERREGRERGGRRGREGREKTREVVKKVWPFSSICPHQCCIALKDLSSQTQDVFHLLQELIVGCSLATLNKGCC